jgi:hypothetical protein
MHSPVVPVLIDPSGLRARRLRAGGRIMGVLFLGWFCGLILAGLGLIPRSYLPLAGTLVPATAPDALAVAVHPRPGATADLLPARAALRPSAAAPVPAGSGAAATPVAATGQHPARPRPAAGAQRPRRAAKHVSSQPHGSPARSPAATVPPSGRPAIGHRPTGPHSGPSSARTPTTHRPTTSHRPATSHPSPAAHGKAGSPVRPGTGHQPATTAPSLSTPPKAKPAPGTTGRGGHGKP